MHTREWVQKRHAFTVMGHFDSFNTTLVVMKVVWSLWTSTPTHTYLAQETPWSMRRFPQGEAPPLHYGWVDPCDHPKCGWLGCAIFVRGGLRPRYPLTLKPKTNSHSSTWTSWCWYVASGLWCISNVHGPQLQSVIILIIWKTARYST